MIPVKIKSLSGKSLTVILVYTQQGKDDEWFVVGGTLRVDKSHVYLDRGKDKKHFPILAEWFDRIKPVKDDVRDILLGADYSLMLSVGDLPDDVDEKDI